jgi:hypothetical protein
MHYIGSSLPQELVNNNIVILYSLIGSIRCSAILLALTRKQNGGSKTSGASCSKLG